MKPAEFYVSDTELVAADKKRMQLKETAESAEKKWRQIAKVIIDTMQARGTKVIEHQGWRVNIVQPEKVKYDEPALISELTKAQTARVVSRVVTVDLRDLTPSDQRALKGVLGPSKWSKALTTALDYSALSQAVQEGLIDPEVVAAHTEVVPTTPYVRSGPASQ